MSGLQSFGSYKNEERIAPAFRLPKVGGGSVASWDYKQRRAFVLVFLPHLDRAALNQLQTLFTALQPFGAQLLVSLPSSIEELAGPEVEAAVSYPVLADQNGLVYRQYLEWAGLDYHHSELPAALFIADRFGAVNRYALAATPAQLPDAGEITAMLEFLGNLCNP